MQFFRRFRWLACACGAMMMVRLALRLVNVEPAGWLQRSEFAAGLLIAGLAALSASLIAALLALWMSRQHQRVFADWTETPPLRFVAGLAAFLSLSVYIPLLSAGGPAGLSSIALIILSAVLLARGIEHTMSGWRPS